MEGNMLAAPYLHTFSGKSLKITVSAPEWRDKEVQKGQY